jgi:hypothetical protein
MLNKRINKENFLSYGELSISIQIYGHLTYKLSVLRVLDINLEVFNTLILWSSLQNVSYELVGYTLAIT